MIINYGQWLLSQFIFSKNQLKICQSDLDQTATWVGLIELARLEEVQVYPKKARVRVKSGLASQVWSQDLILESGARLLQLSNRVWVTQVRKELDSTHHSLTLWFSSNIFNDRLEFSHRHIVRKRQHDIEMLEPDAASTRLSHGCYLLYSKWSSLCFFNNFRHPKLNFITNTTIFRNCP